MAETEHKASAAELDAAEAHERLAIDGWLHAYKEFPTHANLDGLVERLRTYQTAWMNGRTRRKD